MGGIFLPLADILREAGLIVVEYEGWEFLSRSSGGWDANPIGVSWHHTASGSQTDEQACNMMIGGLSYSPVANIGIGGEGFVHLMAGGATNTTGECNSRQMSRGAIPASGANTRTVGMEIINAGTGGDPYTEATINAAFAASNAINRYLGNAPQDIYTHNVITLLDPSNQSGSARKIDPAKVGDVQGPWRPDDIGNGAGSWSNDSVVVEAIARWETDDMGLTAEDKDWIKGQLDKQPKKVWEHQVAGPNGKKKTMAWYVTRAWRMGRWWLGPSKWSEPDLPNPTRQGRIEDDTSAIRKTVSSGSSAGAARDASDDDE